jgi:hypothetical protein
MVAAEAAAALFAAALAAAALAAAAPAAAAALAAALATAAAAPVAAVALFAAAASIAAFDTAASMAAFDASASAAAALVAAADVPAGVGAGAAGGGELLPVAGNCRPTVPPSRSLLAAGLRDDLAPASLRAAAKSRPLPAGFAESAAVEPLICVGSVVIGACEMRGVAFIWRRTARGVPTRRGGVTRDTRHRPTSDISRTSPVCAASRPRYAPDRAARDLRPGRS